MIYLSQRDPRWSHVKLGDSQLTVGRYGCTTTCISMISDYFRCYVRPDIIAADASRYTKDGLVLWQNMKFANFKFEKRLYTRDDTEIITSLKDPKKAVILQVDNQQHWVVALSKTWFGKDYNVLDPWFGDKRTACGTYKNITGSAHFVRK
jgi:ABC-type bacteriocin/lantibiotic exporter with double-glycine peptidase domain